MNTPPSKSRACFILTRSATPPEVSVWLCNCHNMAVMKGDVRQSKREIERKAWVWGVGEILRDRQEGGREKED